MRINLIIAGLLICYGNIVSAQVGSPTNAVNANAVLDLNNTNGTAQKGLLLPKMILASTLSALPMSMHVEGMHVYNTATAGTGITKVTPGEYYNDGTQWIRINNAGDAWSRNGNSGTNAAVNGLGTSDNTDLVFKTNNIERMRVLSLGTVLLGSTTLPTGATSTKLSITHNENTPALIIKDGTQCAGCVLTSDVNGVARWENKDNLFKIYLGNVSQTFTGPGVGNVSRASGTGGTALQTDSPISITKAGNYIAAFTWYGPTDEADSVTRTVSAYISLWKNGVMIDEIEYYMTLVGVPEDSYEGFTTKLIAPNCNVGDVLTIKIAPSIGNQTAMKNWYSIKGGVKVKLFKV